MFEFDPTVLELLKTTPAPILYLIGIIILWRTNKKQNESNHKEMVALIDRYHAGQLDHVRQLTIIAEELKEDDRKHELPEA